MTREKEIEIEALKESIAYCHCAINSYTAHRNNVQQALAELLCPFVPGEKVLDHNCHKYAIKRIFWCSEMGTATAHVAPMGTSIYDIAHNMPVANMTNWKKQEGEQ